jgi:hypothetical protein
VPFAGSCVSSCANKTSARSCTSPVTCRCNQPTLFHAASRLGSSNVQSFVSAFRCASCLYSECLAWPLHQTAVTTAVHTSIHQFETNPISRRRRTRDHDVYIQSLYRVICGCYRRNHLNLQLLILSKDIGSLIFRDVASTSIRPGSFGIAEEFFKCHLLCTLGTFR